MLEVRGIEGVRVLVGLLSLTHRFSRDALEQACAIALSHGAFRLRTIRQLAQRHAPPEKQLQFLEEHPLIRPMGEYAVRFGIRNDEPMRLPQQTVRVDSALPMQQENAS
jgi:hypothetical protein